MTTHIEGYVLRGWNPPSTMPVDLKECYNDEVQAYERIVDSFPGNEAGRAAAQKALGLMKLSHMLGKWPSLLRGTAAWKNQAGEAIWPPEKVARILDAANRIEDTLTTNEWVFDLLKLKITRARQSVTQGSVEVSYSGQLVERFGDDVRMIYNSAEAMSKSVYPFMGRLIRTEEDLCGCIDISGHAGLPDKTWQDAARRLVKLSDPEILYALYRDACRLAESVCHPYLSNKGDLQDIVGRSIILGYEHIDGFATTPHALKTLIGQLACNYPYLYLANDRQQTIDILDKALARGATHPELKENGCEIERGSISESEFYSAHRHEDGWAFFPTGQEPYTMVKVNPDNLAVATYSEGDYSLVKASDAQTLEAELMEAARFYARHYNSLDELTGNVSPVFLERFPRIEDACREGLAEKASCDTMRG